MFFEPTGSSPSEKQARDLDDALFGANPMGYFRARIDTLLSHADPDAPRSEHEMRSAFTSLLGNRENLLATGKSDRELQVAVDAFALRHHAAEVLVRFFHTVAVAEPGEPVCVWATLTDGPRQNKQVCDDILAFLSSQENRDRVWTNFFPESVLRVFGIPHVADQLNNAIAWLLRAGNLLTHEDIDLSGAYNKVKHGLAMRARNDERMALVKKPPTAAGSVPVSAFQGEDALDIFTSVTMRTLNRPAGQKNAQGKRVKAELEVTSLNLVPEKLLAETWMLATVLGALFHTAAVAHFERHPTSDTDDPPLGGPPGRHHDEVPPYPALPFGPSPRSVVGNDLIGLRTPVTHRPDGSIGRGTAFAFEQGTIPLTMDITKAMRGRIVEDEEYTDDE